MFGVRACSLRLTNVYGPRQLIKHNRQGFIAWFIRLAIENREIQIYGDGSQLRDFVYVDDAADAFLRAGATDASNGQVFNVGGLEPISHRDLVELLVSVAGSGRYRFVEWPPEKKAIDIGDFYADSSLIKRTLGWQPTTPLRDGLQRTIEFYRAHLHEYVPDGRIAGHRCEGADHRRRRIHRFPPRRTPARARTRRARARQPVDRVDRQHRAPQGRTSGSRTSSIR